MSDNKETVKRIIEITKDIYERCKEYKLWSYDAETLEGAVATSKPLSENKAEDRPKMTYDEMIDVLKGLVFGTFDRTTAKEREALNMAISDLSTPSANVISIDQANAMIKSYVSHYDENRGEWIPVSERLPENDTEVVYQSERGGVGSCHYYNGFNNYPNTDPDCIFTDIVAWIPIPEPYKADMRGKAE